MNVIILSARTGWHTDELNRALTAGRHTSQILPYEGLVARLGRQPRGVGGAAGSDGHGLFIDGKVIFNADAVLARIVPNGSLEQIVYRVDALHWIEQRGVVVMNSPRAIERSVDKFYATALLQDAGLPAPETVVCEGTAEAMTAVDAMRDVVIKPLFGSMGHGLIRVSHPDLAFRVVRSLEQLRAVFYVQRAIDHEGRDIRVFVVGGRVLGAIERCASDGDWRTNVARGASVRTFSLPPEWEELALRAAATMGTDYAGVDLLPSRDGQVFVLEVNGIPGWQGLQQATGIDVASAIVQHLEERVQRVQPLNP